MVDTENLEPQAQPQTDTLSSISQNDQLPTDESRTAEKDDWIVKFDNNDRQNPKNFKTSYKVFLTFQMSMLALSGSLGSSIVSPAQSAIESQLDVGPEVAALTLSLFVLGKLISNYLGL